MMNPIGIMQGRLSPPVGGRIQSFPVNTWRDEFDRAAEAGLHCIEWIDEAETESVNPISSEAGLADVRHMIENSGVQVWSVCADYFMTHRLVDPDGIPCHGPGRHLDTLLHRGAILGIKYVVLPFVDASSLKSPRERDGLLSVLESHIANAERTGIELHLETDVPPKVLAQILERFSHPLVRANYDIGNSASLGHDPVEELTLLGPKLGSVHVKDRIRGGGTVPLGTGDANFRLTFGLIARSGFCGPYILQAARDEGIGEVGLARINRAFVMRYLSEVKNEPPHRANQNRNCHEDIVHRIRQ